MKDLGTVYRIELTRDEVKFIRDGAAKMPESWDQYHPNIDRPAYVERLQRLLDSGVT